MGLPPDGTICSVAVCGVTGSPLLSAGESHPPSPAAALPSALRGTGKARGESGTIQPSLGLQEQLQNANASSPSLRRQARESS